MLTFKRVLIATICGFVFGFVCMTLAGSNPGQPVSTSLKLTILFSRVIMGFTIGISTLKLPWWLHGVVIGIIGSIPMAFPVMDKPEVFAGTFVMGIIYGFLTELITSVLFKAKSVVYSTAK
jgi:hypothetical protein